MAYIVINKTGQHYLKSTIWTSDKDTATHFDSEDVAKIALSKAAVFNPRGAKGAVIQKESE